MAHGETAGQMPGMFPGVSADQMTDGEGWGVELVQMPTHNGTHMDAPWHYHSTMDGGKPSITIDEVPLDWCWGPGMKRDFRHFEDGSVASAADVEAELGRIGHDLVPCDVALVNAAAGARYGQPDRVDTGCGVGREATLYLTTRGVRVCGTDASSWDAPFSYTARRVAETGDAGLIWEGPRAGIVRAHCHIENLANLETLPTTGFEVICFPVKVKAASAGGCRPVALFRD